MIVLTTQSEIDQYHTRTRGAGNLVVVPTMGALHEGHAALIRRGAALARERGISAGCVVTIFVNPTQFDQPADLKRYPRTFETDAKLCEASGAAAIFAPATETVYPPEITIEVPPLPAVATAPGLEDAQRPSHFAGVCQVVNRLFNLVKPGAAIFGEKDWQQLQVVRAMVKASGEAIEIIGAPIVRDPDGLALSSRNRFLSADDRRRGLTLSRSLAAAGACRSAAEAEHAMRQILSAEGIIPDYAVVRNAESLRSSANLTRGRALIAAKVGSVRLIDNAPWHAD